MPAGPQDTVVVAAGDELARRVLVTVLRHQGWAVDEVDDLAGIRRVAAGRPVRAVVLDGGLPDGDGASVVRRLRGAAGTAALPTVLLTTDEVGVRAGVAAGADAVLTMPFSPLHLVEVLADLTEPLDGGPDERSRARVSA